MTESKETRKFKCYLCGQEFDSLADLMKHDLRLKHKREKSTSTSSEQKQRP